MPTATSVGNTTFREVSVSPTINRSGADTLTVVLRGRSALLATAINSWGIGSNYPGYPSMFLESRSHEDKGPVSEIILNFVGVLNSNETVLETEDAISLQSVSLTTSTGENVNLQYYSQSNTTRWITRGSPPGGPRYPSTIPTTIDVNMLFAPDPPNFDGSLAGRYRPVGRLTQFTRSEIVPNIFIVVETWELRVEPVSA